MDGTDNKPDASGKTTRSAVHFYKKRLDYSQSFYEGASEFDSRMKCASKHVLLLIDNASVHVLDKHTSQLGETTLKLLLGMWRVFLPPNCTSILQPVGMEINRALKAHYRRFLLEANW